MVGETVVGNLVVEAKLQTAAFTGQVERFKSSMRDVAGQTKTATAEMGSLAGVSKVATLALGAVGIAGVGGLIRFLSVSPRVGASLALIGFQAERVAIAVGEEVAPAFEEAAEGADTFADAVDEFLKKKDEIGVARAFIEAELGLAGKAFDFAGTKVGGFADLLLDPLGTGGAALDLAESLGIVGLDTAIGNAIEKFRTLIGLGAGETETRTQFPPGDFPPKIPAAGGGGGNQLPDLNVNVILNQQGQVIDATATFEDFLSTKLGVNLRGLGGTNGGSQFIQTPG